MAGDASPPGKRRLLGAAIGVKQAVAGGHVHHHEGIEHHPVPGRVQLLDGLDDALIRRRAAEGRHGPGGRGRAREPRWIERCEVERRDEGRSVASLAGDRPVVGRRHLRPRLDLGHDLAGAGPEVGAEPGNDQRYRTAVRQRLLELTERDQEIRRAVGVWLFSGNQLPNPSDDFTTVVPSTNSPAPGRSATPPSRFGRSFGSAIGGARTISAVICGIRLPKSSSVRLWNTR